MGECGAMERLFIVGANHEAGDRDWPVERRFELSGRNTGNLLIGNGLHRQLKYARWGGDSIASDPQRIRENYDRIVLPASNFLGGHADFSRQAEFVDSVDLPCLMVGLGAQSPSDEQEVAHIPKGTIRFIHAVADRSNTIGVRGYYTAEVLRGLGVNNVDVVGCPSFYTNLSQPVCIREIDFDSVERIVFNGSSNVIPHAYDQELARNVERKLFRMADDRDFPYVLQSEIDQILHLVDLKAEQNSGMKRSAKILGYPDVVEFASVVRRIGKVFFEVQEWFDWMGDKDLVVGTRIHGAVAGLLQGVPAIVIYHDSRTKEMSELMNFPRASLAEASVKSLREIYDQADFEKCNRRHEVMLDRYVDFLDKNGISHRFGDA